MLSTCSSSNRDRVAVQIKTQSEFSDIMRFENIHTRGTRCFKAKHDDQ